VAWTVTLPPAVTDRSSRAVCLSSVVVMATAAPTAAPVVSTDPSARLSLSPRWSAVIARLPVTAVLICGGPFGSSGSVGAGPVRLPTRATVSVSVRVTATTGASATPPLAPAFA
jgi:hypothetical protein